MNTLECENKWLLITSVFFFASKTRSLKVLINIFIGINIL